MADLVEEKQHARLSPSSSKRWMTCPGSVKFIESLNIVDKPSKYAAEGTVAHEVHELCLLKKLPASKFLGRTISSDGMKFKVNQNMVDAVQLSLDYIWNRVDELEFEGYRVELKVEVRASLEFMDIPGLDGGTSDLVIIAWDGDNIAVIEIFDYKHGAGVAVEVENNTQALSYALGVCAYYQVKEDTPVIITISQPRAFHPDGRIRDWKIEAGDVLKWMEEELRPKALATLEENANLVASDEGCRFCNAAGQCPKLYNRVQEVAMIDFDTVDDLVSLPPINTLTDSQKLFIVENADTIRSFLSSVENQVREDMNLGSSNYSSALKLVRKSTHRKFTEDAFDEIASPLFDYLEEEDLYEKKPRSLTEIERRLKKLAGKEAANIMIEITTKPEGELVVAPITDHRKAEEASITSDFTGL